MKVRSQHKKQVSPIMIATGRASFIVALRFGKGDPVANSVTGSLDLTKPL
jgi:hypothetical protein